MGYMRCPFCGQEIDSESRKCFFCNSDLSHFIHHEEPKQIQMQKKLSEEAPQISLK